MSEFPSPILDDKVTPIVTPAALEELGGPPPSDGCTRELGYIGNQVGD